MCGAAWRLEKARGGGMVKSSPSPEYVARGARAARLVRAGWVVKAGVPVVAAWHGRDDLVVLGATDPGPLVLGYCVLRTAYCFFYLFFFFTKGKKNMYQARSKEK